MEGRIEDLGMKVGMSAFQRERRDGDNLVKDATILCDNYWTSVTKLARSRRTFLRLTSQSPSSCR